MKLNKFLLFIVACLMVLQSCKKDNASADSIAHTVQTNESLYTKTWRDNKLSMMIHFGLYSHFGGVYNGNPVTKGYSEQIMAHAPIPNNEYIAAAANFNPAKWNATEIASIAKRGGFKSVVFTAKHHDGFCMFDSQHSDFTITKSSPYKKDILKELADACRTAGLEFGIYFSLIDWNAKEGATIPSSHNADSISPALHALNIAQIKELCSNYGSISELWFDMGSLTMAQSKEIRSVVKELQPQCMIGGRLSNGQGDFDVMADNQMPPDMKFEGPWQTVNSIFSNTWGYRSWQSAGDPNQIAKDHLSRIVKTIIKGGNYMLNIGPKDDGTILPLEKEVIEKIGNWVNPHQQAIFGTRPMPGGEKSWGGIVYNSSNLFMHINALPSEGELVVYGIKNAIITATTLLPPFTPLVIKPNGATTTFDLGLINLKFEPATIVSVSYDGALDLLPAKQIYPNTTNKYELTTFNANTSYAMAGTNYYTTVPSVTKYAWYINNPKENIEYEIMLYYSQEEKDRKIKLSLNGKEEIVDLSKYKTFYQEPNDNKTIPSSISYQGPYTNMDMNSHPGPLGWASQQSPWGKEQKQWTELSDLDQGKIANLAPNANQSYYYLISILGTVAVKNHIVAFGADDACMAWINGRLVYSSGFPKKEPNAVFVDLPIEQETNTFIIKHFNTSGSFKTFFTLLLDQIRFEKIVSLNKFIPNQPNLLEVTLAEPTFPNENLNIPNIKIIIQEKSKK